MRSTTTKPTRTWDWPRTHRDDALSNDTETSSQRQFCADCIIATPRYDFREGQLLDNPSPRHLRLRVRSARTAGLLCSLRESAKKSLRTLAHQIRTRSARYGIVRHRFLDCHNGRAELASVHAIRLCTPRRSDQC